MDQSELLKLARASLKKKGRTPRPSAVEPPAREAESEPYLQDGRTDDVESALSRIAALDRKLAKLAEAEEASRRIQEAENRVLTLESVDAADETVRAMDEHIAAEHEFATFDIPRAGRQRTGGRQTGATRDAFRFHLLMGPPKSMSF